MSVFDNPAYQGGTAYKSYIARGGGGSSSSGSSSNVNTASTPTPAKDTSLTPTERALRGGMFKGIVGTSVRDSSGNITYGGTTGSQFSGSISSGKGARRVQTYGAAGKISDTDRVRVNIGGETQWVTPERALSSRNINLSGAQQKEAILKQKQYNVRARSTEDAAKITNALRPKSKSAIKKRDNSTVETVNINNMPIAEEGGFTVGTKDVRFEEMLRPAMFRDDPVLEVTATPIPMAKDKADFVGPRMPEPKGVEFVSLDKVKVEKAPFIGPKRPDKSTLLMGDSNEPAFVGPVIPSGTETDARRLADLRGRVNYLNSQSTLIRDTKQVSELENEIAKFQASLQKKHPGIDVNSLLPGTVAGTTVFSSTSDASMNKVRKDLAGEILAIKREKDYLNLIKDKTAEQLKEYDKSSGQIALDLEIYNKRDKAGRVTDAERKKMEARLGTKVGGSYAAELPEGWRTGDYRIDLKTGKKEIKKEGAFNIETYMGDTPVSLVSQQKVSKLGEDVEFAHNSIIDQWMPATGSKKQDNKIVEGRFKELSDNQAIFINRAVKQVDEIDAGIAETNTLIGDDVNSLTTLQIAKYGTDGVIKLIEDDLEVLEAEYKKTGDKKTKASIDATKARLADAKKEDEKVSTGFGPYFKERNMSKDLDIRIAKYNADKNSPSSEYDAIMEKIANYEIIRTSNVDLTKQEVDLVDKINAGDTTLQSDIDKRNSLVADINRRQDIINKAGGISEEIINVFGDKERIVTVPGELQRLTEVIDNKSAWERMIEESGKRSSQYDGLAVFKKSENSNEDDKGLKQFLGAITHSSDGFIESSKWSKEAFIKAGLYTGKFLATAPALWEKYGDNLKVAAVSLPSEPDKWKNLNPLHAVLGGYDGPYSVSPGEVEGFGNKAGVYFDNMQWDAVEGALASTIIGTSLIKGLTAPITGEIVKTNVGQKAVELGKASWGTFAKGLGIGALTGLIVVPETIETIKGEQNVSRMASDIAGKLLSLKLIQEGAKGITKTGTQIKKTIVARQIDKAITNELATGGTRAVPKGMTSSYKNDQTISKELSNQRFKKPLDVDTAMGKIKIELSPTGTKPDLTITKLAKNQQKGFYKMGDSTSTSNVRVKVTFPDGSVSYKNIADIYTKSGIYPGQRASANELYNSGYSVRKIGNKYEAFKETGISKTGKASTKLSTTRDAATSNRIKISKQQYEDFLSRDFGVGSRTFKIPSYKQYVANRGTGEVTLTKQQYKIMLKSYRSSSTSAAEKLRIKNYLESASEPAVNQQSIIDNVKSISKGSQTSQQYSTYSIKNTPANMKIRIGGVDRKIETDGVKYFYKTATGRIVYVNKPLNTFSGNVKTISTGKTTTGKNVVFDKRTGTFSKNSDFRTDAKTNFENFKSKFDKVIRITPPKPTVPKYESYVFKGETTYATPGANVPVLKTKPPEVGLVRDSFWGDRVKPTFLQKILGNKGGSIAGGRGSVSRVNFREASSESVVSGNIKLKTTPKNSYLARSKPNKWDLDESGPMAGRRSGDTRFDHRGTDSGLMGGSESKLKGDVKLEVGGTANSYNQGQLTYNNLLKTSNMGSQIMRGLGTSAPQALGPGTFSAYQLISSLGNSKTSIGESINQPAVMGMGTTGVSSLGKSTTGVGAIPKEYATTEGGIEGGTGGKTGSEAISAPDVIGGVDILPPTAVGGFGGGLLTGAAIGGLGGMVWGFPPLLAGNLGSGGGTSSKRYPSSWTVNNPIRDLWSEFKQKQFYSQPQELTSRDVAQDKVDTMFGAVKGLDAQKASRVTLGGLSGVGAMAALQTPRMAMGGNQPTQQTPSFGNRMVEPSKTYGSKLSESLSMPQSKILDRKMPSGTFNTRKQTTVPTVKKKTFKVKESVKLPKKYRTTRAVNARNMRFKK